ncbi:hypothetical protein [uncultured Cetobacterium sp.]|uniref:hypothetical protein n=1 Tax=uncultured Cetobacterium sp. TaxID=527638 RepID=UPI002606FC49|nr:hypothetical protein [uncultured Cetobacterium sp.]
MKKLILASLLLLSSLSYASWWGNLDGGARAAIVTGSALLLGSEYNQSDYKHEQDLKQLDQQIRRGYEREAVIENANRKYRNIGVPSYLASPNNNTQYQYQQSRNNGVKVIYSDSRSQILQMPDGRRIILNQ